MHVSLLRPHSSLSSSFFLLKDMETTVTKTTPGTITTCFLVCACTGLYKGWGATLLGHFCCLLTLRVFVYCELFCQDSVHGSFVCCCKLSVGKVVILLFRRLAKIYLMTLLFHSLYLNLVTLFMLLYLALKYRITEDIDSYSLSTSRLLPSLIVFVS